MGGTASARRRAGSGRPLADTVRAAACAQAASSAAAGGSPRPQPQPDPPSEPGVRYAIVTGAVADRVQAAREHYPAEAAFYDKLATLTDRLYYVQKDGLNGPWVAVWRRTSQPKNACATSYHSRGTVFSSAVASASETSTIASPCSAAIRPKPPSCDEVGGLEAVARREHAVAGSRGAAALDVAEDGHPGLEAGPVLDLPRRARRRRRARQPDVPELGRRRRRVAERPSSS